MRREAGVFPQCRGNHGIGKQRVHLVNQFKTLHRQLLIDGALKTLDDIFQDPETELRHSPLHKLQ